MYYYIYDSFIHDVKYDKILSQVETRLTDLGISGRIGRLNLLNNTRELIEDQIKNGATTIVAVGNDRTVNEALSILADHGNAVLGVIPVGDIKDNKIAESLGIASPLEACEVLSKRIVKKIDLGKINNHYFLSNLKVKSDFPGKNITKKIRINLECDDKYNVVFYNTANKIGIYNLKYLQEDQLFKIDKTYFNPLDGKLTVVIHSNGGFWNKTKKAFLPFAANYQDSIFTVKKIAITNNGGSSIFLVADGVRNYKLPVLVEIAPAKLRLVVGKKRIF